MALTIDLNEITQGKVEIKTFADKIASMDWSSYEGQEVRIKGCAPTWAHLMVAGRLFGKVKRLEFLMDNRAGGVPIEVFRSP